MSGICGIVRLDGGPIEATEIEGMIALLERRGPDGSQRWLGDSIALGHTLLATTPEAAIEKLPFVHAESGCTVTADARLDNREELAAAIGLDLGSRTVGDGELILRAYLEWGEDCPKHLLGDFAFAIWDGPRRRLFCARDQIGMRQLIYCHLPGSLFLFATEPGAVLAHPGAPRSVNRERIADVLEDLEGIDWTSTLFESLFRLPPAHSLSVSPDGLSLRRYWTLEVPPELRLDSDEAYAKAFMDVFTTAVSCRLRGSGPVGSMLSGGLDSTSVAALASRILADRGAGPLATFSAIGPDPAACPETRSVQSAAASPLLRPTFVDHSELAPYADELGEAVETLDDPFDAHMNLVRAVYLAAARSGVRAVLDGVGADVVFTSGNRIAALLSNGKLRQAIAEARGESRFWRFGPPPARLLLAAAWAGLVPAPVRRMRRRLIDWLGDRLAASGRRRLNRQAARQLRLAERRGRYRAHLGEVVASDRDYQYLMIAHPHIAAARERYDRISSAFAVEARDPFLDLRLIRFCLSLPLDQLRSGGWTKIVMRRAVSSLLPPDVVWRHGKDHLGMEFTTALIRLRPHWQARWRDAAPRLREFCPPGLLARASKGADGSREGWKEFIELFSLGCWLVRYDAR